MSQTIICPNCNTSIDLDQIAEHKYAEIQKEQEQKLKEAQTQQEKIFQEKLEQEKIEMRKQLKEYSEKKVLEERKKVELEMKDIQEQLKKSEEIQAEAQKKQLEFMKAQRALEEKEKNFDLELEKKLLKEKEYLEKKLKAQQAEEQILLEKKLKKNQEEVLAEKLKQAQAQQEQIREQEQEAFRKKELELLKQQEQMKKALDEAKRKAEQGSQQIQGDIQEDDLKKSLELAFVFDKIVDVPTGVRGADLVHVVNDNFGRKKGIILWESKNTKSWQDAWIKKLKDDQVEAKADICILATTTMPKDIQNFGEKDGVWIVDYRFALSLAHILRTQILEISKVKTSLKGKDEKMNFLYEYLSGPQFKNRIENIVSAFTGMQTDLITEKRAMQKIWTKREKEIDRMMLNTTGLYGDMQGIISLPTIEQLELPEGEEPESPSLF